MEQKQKKTRGTPRKMGKKGKKESGFHYKLAFARAEERKKRRMAKREAGFAKRRKEVSDGSEN